MLNLNDILEMQIYLILKVIENAGLIKVRLDKFLRRYHISL